MTNNTIKFLSTKEDVGNRLDVILAKKITSLTRSSLKKIIESKKVKINGLIINSPSKKIKINDTVTINLERETNFNLKPSKVKLDIVYEDKDIIIVNKPSGMVVHPGAGNYENTLVNGLIYKYKKKII